jgi:hypothetical protein
MSFIGTLGWMLIGIGIIKGGIAAIGIVLERAHK